MSLSRLPTTADLLDFATHLAWTGGRRTLAWFRTAVPTELKADGSPVTLADKDAEATMRALLKERFPDHGIVGEEHGEEPGTAPIRWIIDPIDGTRTFIRGVPFYGTLVGVEVHGEPTVGVIYIPALDELVAAGKGLGCTLNGRRCRVAANAALDKSLLVATDLGHVVERLGPDGYAALVGKTGMQRTWADCYAYVLVATGRAEVAMDAVMALWDNAALLPVIEEAGGRFTNWKGQRTIQAGDALATNGLVHDEVLGLLSGAKPSPRA
ncbi:MAG: inositol monophosphatase family protein [Myxococcota bacterium]